MSHEYKDQVFRKSKEKMDEICRTLPPPARDFLRFARDREDTTRLLYARRLEAFFAYASVNIEGFMGIPTERVTLEQILSVTKKDIENFIYEVEGHPSRSSKKTFPDRFGANVCSNTVNGYLSALSAFWEFLVQSGYTDMNTIKSIRRKKKPGHDIKYLKHDEAEALVENVWKGEGLTKRVLGCQEKHNTAIRDSCMLRIFCTTGIRLSELVGLNVDDYVRSKAGRDGTVTSPYILVTRKGDREARIYLSDSTAEALDEYLDERDSYSPAAGEKAMFLVAVGKYRGQRLGVRSVENIVHKYADTLDIPHPEDISVHKLRSTFAMNLLERSRDISLVQKRLGHKNPSTTAIYAEARNEAEENSRNLL